MGARRRCRTAVTVVGLAVACSENPSPARHIGDARVETGSCARLPCAGSCRDSRCLTTLVEVAAPGHIAVDDTRAYFTSCSSNGTGAVLWSGLAGHGEPVVMANGSRCPGALGLGADGLYAAGLDANDVVRIPPGGDSITSIGTAPDTPIGIAVDDASAYVATRSGTLLAVPLRGGASIELVSGEKSLTAPAVDTTDVYFGAPIGGTVKKVPRGGGPAITLTTADTVTALALSDTDVYFATGYVVQSVPKAGGAPTTLGTAAGADIVALAIDDASVYFASYGVLWKIPLAGGAAAQVAGGQADITSIAVDGTSVYFTNGVHSPAAPDVCCGSVVKVTPK